MKNAIDIISLIFVIIFLYLVAQPKYQKCDISEVQTTCVEFINLPKF